MNRDTIIGKAKQMQGKLQDAMGDLTENVRDDLAGKAKQAEGKVQEESDKAKHQMGKIDHEPAEKQ